LKAALEFPWEKWAVFLHPAQRSVVERDFSGPARVAGSAGTGKTVVALHRVVRILRQDRDARVLLTTFSEPLASALSRKLEVLVADDPRCWRGSPSPPPAASPRSSTCWPSGARPMLPAAT
jgi:superfamily I DNA/RNA helicase